MNPTRRTTAVAAWLAAVVAATTAIAAVCLVATEAADADPVPVKPLLLTAVWLVPGLLIALARPRILLGWLALGQALLFAAAALGDAWVRYGGDVGTGWAAWVTDRFSAFLAVGVWLILILLPDGRLPSPRWRVPVGVVVAVQCLALVAFSAVRGPAAGPDSDLPPDVLDVPNPVGVLPPVTGDWLDGLDAVLLQAPLLLALVAYVARLRGAGPDERARVVGVLVASSTFVLVVVIGHAWLPQIAEFLDVAAALVLAVQLTAAVLQRRPRLAGVVARQTFVYTVLTAVVGGLAVLVAPLLRESDSGTPGFGLAVVAAAIALAVHPLRVRLARFVDRLLYGDLADPYRALQGLADRTHTAPSVDAVLQGLAASVAASLRVPWCCVEAVGHAGTWGEPPEGSAETVRDLVCGGTKLGLIRVTGGPGRRLNGSEQRLLADLGRHGGVAVQAVLLTDALRAGRQRLVMAREEERRHLRRDLHDGVGPTLAGLTMQLGAVRALVRADPAAVEDRLGRLQEAARGALDSVRRLSHGLRPPALDELGLVGALRQLAESLGLRARICQNDDPRLPAAVEVAAYLIGAEALHNAARHAGTADVEVSVHAADGELVLRIADGGAGRDPDRPVGVGLLAMRERAEELGGMVAVDSAPGLGTTVTARLPAAVAEPQVLA